MTKRSPLVVALVALACGTSPPVPRDEITALVLGGSGDERATDVAVDELGNVILAGTFEGEADLGLGILTSSGDRDIFVLKLNELLVPQWVFTLGGDTGQGDEPVEIAIGPDREVVLLATLRGTAEVAGGTLSGDPAGSAVLVAIDADGSARTARAFAGAVGTAIVVNRLGQTTVALNEGSMARVVELDAEFEPVWERDFAATTAEGEPGFVTVDDLAPTSNDRVVTFGRFRGSLDLMDGSQPLEAPDVAGWFGHLRGSSGGTQSATTITADVTNPNGRTLTVDDFGVKLGGPRYTVFSPEVTDVIIDDTIVDGGDLLPVVEILGDTLWQGETELIWFSYREEETRRVELFSSTKARFRGVARNSYGDIYVVGELAGTATVGPRVLTSSGGMDLFLLELAAPPFDED